MNNLQPLRYYKLQPEPETIDISENGWSMLSKSAICKFLVLGEHYDSVENYLEIQELAKNNNKSSDSKDKSKENMYINLMRSTTDRKLRNLLKEIAPTRKLTTNEIKSCLYTANCSKFYQNDDLAQLLMKTGKHKLVDKTVCTEECQVLMRIRDDLIFDCNISI